MFSNQTSIDAASAPTDSEGSRQRRNNKRSQVKLACNQCRARKTKCSGISPCDRCSRDGLDCSFDDRLDLVASLRQERNSLRAILESIHQTLRSGRDAEIRDLQSLASVTQLNAFLKHMRPPASEMAESPTALSSDAEDTSPEISLAAARRGSDTTYAPEALVAHIETYAASDSEPVTSLSASASTLAGKSVPDAWALSLPDQRSKWQLERPSHPQQSTATSVANVAGGSTQQSSGSPDNSQTLPPDVGGRLAQHQIRALYLTEDSALGSLFARFFSAAVEQIKSGDLRVLGGQDTDVELFYRDRRPDDPYDVHNWAAELARSLQDYDRCLLLAMIYHWSALLRRMLSPTVDHYAAHPEMIQPQSGRHDLFSHGVGSGPEPPIAWSMPALAQNLDGRATDSASRAGASVGWMRPESEAVQVNPRTGRRCLTRDFIRHVHDASNPEDTD